MVEVENKYMARCISLARGGAGNVAPNPMVGAVIVHQGKIIGEGYHRKYGEAHAEGRRRFPTGGERDSGYQYGIRLRKLRRTVHDIQFIAGNLP